MTSSLITPTPHQLRALAHPVRLRMLGLLRIEGPATATTLATRLGLNTGATSYHLRQLAQHGFIVDDTSQGNGRERWWKAAHSSTRTAAPAPDDAEGADSVNAYLQTVVTVYCEWMQRSVEELALLPEAWGAATTYSDYKHRITPARAQAIVSKIDEMLSEIVDDEDEDVEAAPFIIQVNAYPYPGSVSEDRP